MKCYTCELPASNAQPCFFSSLNKNLDDPIKFMRQSYYHYLLLPLLSLLPSSSSFVCVSECFLTGVWLFDIHFVSLGKPFVCSRPSNGSAVLLLSLFYLFIYLFILSTFTQSFLFFYSFSFTFSWRALGEK